jgi:hypothetical protein
VLPVDHSLHLCQELLPLGALLGDALFEIGEPELLATQEVRPGRQSGLHFPMNRWDYPELDELKDIEDIY